MTPVFVRVVMSFIMALPLTIIIFSIVFHNWEALICSSLSFLGAVVITIFIMAEGRKNAS